MATRDTIYSADIVTPCNRRQLVSVLDEGVTKLPPESDGSGNVEYKTKLNNTSNARTSHLATQLQWRLSEGCGHAVYVVGVHDDGSVVGITEDEFQLTLDILHDMASQLSNTHVSSINKRILTDQENRVVAEVGITQHSSMQRTELRVAVLGEQGVGKSTVLGCLTYGEADNGRGKARLNLLRHRHEVESGRTSSISMGTIGFDNEGQVLSYANNSSAEQIFRRSQHVVTFIDTCGYSKHLKTTIRAITGHCPHVFCIVIAADPGAVSEAAREYMRLAAVLNMPLMVIISKMDLATKATFGTLMRDLLETLSEVVPNRGKCIVTGSTADGTLGEDMMDLAVVPIFTTSAIRSVGFSEVTSVLAKSRVAAATDSNGCNGKSRPFEFHIEHLYSFDAVGTVVTGWTHAGIASSSLPLSRDLVIGPDSTGAFVPVEMTSIHTLRMPAKAAEAGSSAAIAIKLTGKTIPLQKGMVIIDSRYLNSNDASGQSLERRVSDEFIARVSIFDEYFLSAHQVIVHIRSAYRLARVVDHENKEDDAATVATTNHPLTRLVRLKFEDGICDYMYPGMPIVARDGQALSFAGHIEAIV
ncbi:GTP binding protein [Coemansia sp. Benny D115]|nr:GTP binding protein [Coemansia sp. Benny D115]